VNELLRLDDDSALAKVALEVTSSLRLADVLTAVTNGLVTTLGVDGAYLWLESSSASGLLELTAWAGLQPDPEDPPVALARLFGDDHYCTNNIPRDGSSGAPTWLESNGLRAVAAYPLTFRGRRLGLLAIFSRRQLTRPAFRRLYFFAQQAAVAVQNAQLFSEVEILRERLSAENAYLRSGDGTDDAGSGIIASSAVMRRVLGLVDQVAPTDSTVLLEGETGAGKEVVARTIHERSRRASRTLVKLNCAAISPNLLESELFGHERGAFTGAIGTRIGRFELADGGTLFLDEIGELPLDLQPKLLRALQEREIERVGASRSRSVDVRVIAATNRNLADEVRAGRFRADLYYRLAVFPIQLPALRDRPEDLRPLAERGLALAARRLGRGFEGFTDVTLQRLERYSWPGNVRELMNVVERAAILSRSSLVDVPRSLLPGVGARDSGIAVTGLIPADEAERQHLVRVLEHARWRIEGPAGAAEISGLPASTLRSRMARLGLQRPR
jgi:transcriptional regulator with GAF, ATPase, and Fis domain